MSSGGRPPPPGVPLVERSIALRRRPGGDPLKLAESLRELGRQIHFVGRYRDEALAFYRSAIERLEANGMPAHPYARAARAALEALAPR